MAIEYITLLLVASLTLLLILGFPISVALISLSGIGYLIFLGPQSLYVIFSTTFVNVTKDIYIAIPLFIFMATILQFSGLSTALYDVMYKWTAGIKGGLAIGTVIACTLIAALTGLGGTGVVTMGMIAYPEMTKRNYKKTLSSGCIIAGGALGPLIPPSVLMIVVGGFASLSVGKLFIGGVVPGLIISVLFIVYIYFISSRKVLPGETLSDMEIRFTWKEKILALNKIILPISLLIFLLVGLYTGIFTPTEAGGIGAGGTLLCAALYRKLNWANIKESSITTFKVNGMIMLLVVGGACFSSLCGALGVTRYLEQALLQLPLSETGFIILMMVIVFFMGMFIETIAIVMICIPVFIPIILKLGIDPLWFALIFIIDVVIGMITPPFGYNLFYMQGLNHDDLSLSDIYKGIIPFVMIMMIVLVLCIVFPQICVWLPNRMIG